VTAWNVQKVAQYATGAGWLGRDLVYAVAVAMAASNGADHIRINPSYAPEMERRGLWLVRALDLPDAPEVDLFDPQANATFAKAVWDANGKAWGWHPVGINGAADAALDWVNESLNGGQPGPRSGAGLSFAQRVQNYATFMEQVRNAVPGREVLSG